MNETKGNGMIVPPSGNEGTIMVPPKEDDLMLPPQPITNEDMTNISGGNMGGEPTPEIELPKPPKMEVVKLEDGRFVNVPADAICDSEEEAKKFMMPPPPGGPHHPHCPHGSHEHHEHHKHHHKHDHYNHKQL